MWRKPEPVPMKYAPEPDAHLMPVIPDKAERKEHHIPIHVAPAELAGRLSNNRASPIAYADSFAGEVRARSNSPRQQNPARPAYRSRVLKLLPISAALTILLLISIQFLNLNAGSVYTSNITSNLRLPASVESAEEDVVRRVQTLIDAAFAIHISYQRSNN